MANSTKPASGPLPTLSQPREFVVGFMRGSRSTFKAGYGHVNATLASIDLCEVRRIELTDAERLLLPCFALGVARGLGSQTATLEALTNLQVGSDDTAALQAYNDGMIYGAWEKRLGDTQPGDR